MLKIRWLGEPIFSPTGYATNVRELCYALSKTCDAKAITDEIPPLKYKDCVTKENDIDSETHLIGRTYTYNQYLLPYENIAKSISGILVLEGDRLPEDWIATANIMDIVWTASKYGEQQFINNRIIPEKIKILPHGIDPNIFYPQVNPQRFPDFTFCFVGGFAIPGDRKGLDIAAKAFHEEFNNKEKVKFIIKINKIYNPNFNAVIYLQHVSNRDDRLFIIDKDMNHAALNNIYNASDVHVMPTMGEAFSMNLAESMACGKTVIATNWSGHLDYCLPEFSFLINIEKFVVAHYGLYDIISGSKWAYPSIKHLKELMRYCFDNQEEVRHKGRKSQRYILDNYKWRDSALKLIELLTQSTTLTRLHLELI